jgi:predicted SprT family Zn-dependent metalloprotease
MALPDDIAPVDIQAWPEGEGWNLVRYMVDACHDLGRPDLIGQIKIEFRSGMKKTVGKAYSMTKTIALSRHYWAYMPEFEKRDTMIHEVCHIATPGQGHRRKWKDAMIQCGAPPDRVLSLTTARLVKRVHAARHGDKIKMWKADRLSRTRYDAGPCPNCKKPMYWTACQDGNPVWGLEARYRIFHVLVGECSYGDSFWDRSYKHEGRENMARDPESEFYHYGRPEARRLVKTDDNYRGWKVEGT